MSTSILLIDEHPLFRAGISKLIDAEPELCLAGEVSDIHAAIPLLKTLAPDLVILSTDGNQAEVVREIKGSSPTTRLLVLSMDIDREAAEEILRAGASGYLGSECEPEDLLEGIQTVMRGDRYLGPNVQELFVSSYIDVLADDSAFNSMIAAQATRELRSPLVLTKIHRPETIRQVVPRARLLEELEIGRRRPFTLISAPAGFGKSTLVGHWLATNGYASAWLSLDAQDNDMRVFLSYLVAAVRSQFPEALPMTALLCGAPTLPALPLLSSTLVNELDRLPQRLILVLDDYHRIVEPAIHNLLAELLRHPPQTLHLVLITRTDPALDLLSLRAYQQMGELRTQALSFTPDETAALLQQVTGAAVSAEIARALTQKTEGWVTGLHLLTLSVKNGEELSGVSQVLPGEQQTLDYLIAEVLSRQPQHVQTWLLKTSILDRFCAPLCAALSMPLVAGDETSLDGQEFIDWLAHHNLFVMALDHHGTWYRYHHLFQELLQTQLEQQFGADEVAALHRRASCWFNDEGLYDDALEHALAGGDTLAAVEIVETNRFDTQNADHTYTLERWLKRLPAASLEGRPKLLLAAAAVAFGKFEMERIPPIVEQVDALLDDQTGDPINGLRADDPILFGELDFYKGNLLYWIGEFETSVTYLERALTLVPGPPWIVRCNIDLMLGFARHACGQTELALSVLTEQTQDFEPSQSFQLAYVVGSITFIRLFSAHLIQAGEEARRMEIAAARSGNSNLVAWGAYLLANAMFHQYDLHRALHKFAEALRLRHVLDPRAVIDAMAGLALTQQMLQRSDDADRTMQMMVKFIHALDDPYSITIAESCRARLDLLQGDLASAVTWARSASCTPSQAALFVWLETPCITHARVLIAIGTQENLAQAGELLERIRKISDACHYVNQAIEVVVLQSLCLERQRRNKDARAALLEAVQLAAKGGWVRPFVELGQPMSTMLEDLRRQDLPNDTVSYINRILSSFPDWVETADQSGLIEPLTERELDIVRLLDTELSPAAIADELVVSVATVRAHTRSIYGKLDAHSRHEAVEQARDLGLI